MAGKNRNYINLRMILLISIAMSLSVGISFAQKQVNTTTAKLVVLSDNIASDDIAKIRPLLEEGADVNAVDINCTTTLIFALGNGNLDIVKELLLYGAKINLKVNDGNTAKNFAEENNYSEILKGNKEKVPNTILYSHPNINLFYKCGCDTNCNFQCKSIDFVQLISTNISDNISV